MKTSTVANPVTTALRPFVRRLRVQHFCTWLLKGIITGLAAAALIFGLARLFPLADNRLWAVGIGLGLLPVAVAAAFYFRPTYWDTALAVDRAGLAERTATARQLRLATDPIGPGSGLTGASIPSSGAN